jgi:putative ABC transport system permease protein
MRPGGGKPAPPRVARWILGLLVGPLHADDVEPALASLFRERCEREGARAARRWYWRQVLGFGVRRHAFTREAGGGAIMDGWTRDLRVAARSLARAPGFTAVAVVTLALGIGANTAIFSVIRGTLLRPLPYDHPERLVWLSDGHPAFGGSGADESVPNLMDLRAGSTLMRSSAIYRVLSGNLSTGERPERVRILYASSDMLRVLGLTPGLGRDLLPADDAVDAEGVALLTDGFWRSHFGADPTAVGRTVTVDARTVRVVGVLPEGFTFPQDPELLMALRHVGAGLNRGARGYFGIGRLVPGADVAGLRTELQGIFDGLVKAYPDANKGWFTWAEPLRDSIVGRNRRALLILEGAVALVLLIALVNVANLLLARAETRHHELAVRYALGARRSGLLSMFLGEGLLLALAGGALGIVSARLGVHLLLTLYGDALPRAGEIELDGAVLAFGLAITSLTAIVVGLIPLARVRPDDVGDVLADGSRGSTGRGTALGTALVITEVALAVLLVAGAGLLANSLWRLQRLDLGVAHADRVMTFQVALPGASYPAAAEIGAFVDQLDARLGSIPGVQGVGFVNRLPLVGGDNTGVTAFGDPSRRADFVSFRFITPGYFAAVGVPLVAGRWLERADFEGGGTSVVVNQTLARRLFPGQDAVGRRIETEWGIGGLQVVGVCADIAGGRADRPAPPAFYMSLKTVLHLWASQPRPANDHWPVGVLVRAAGPPGALVPALRAGVAAVDRQLPIYDVRTLQAIAADRLGVRRFALSLFGVFAGVALLLGAVGIYGVMSFALTRRSAELGMRLALGATPGTVLRMVLAQGARLTAPGLLIGLAGALASSRVLEGLLYEVSPLDPWTYAAVVLVLALVAAAATWLPARRATRTDPVASLRGG